MDYLIIIIYLFLCSALLLYGDYKANEKEKDMMKKGGTGKARKDRFLFIFLANEEQIIIEGKMGKSHIKGIFDFYEFDEYNNFHITEAIEIARHNINKKKFFNSKEKCIFMALEELQDNLMKSQSDNKNENKNNHVNN